MGAEVTVNASNFQKEVKEADVPVLVDFWAEWCVPCRMVAPVLEQLSEEYQGKLKIAKVNVDQEADLASQYNIISIPTLLLFHKGEAVDQKVGAAPKPAIEEMFRQYL